MLLKNEIGILITPHHVVSLLIIETEIEYSMQRIDPGLNFMTIKIIIFTICFVLRTS